MRNILILENDKNYSYIWTEHCRTDSCSAPGTDQCVEIPSGYNCSCRTGFTGDRCQTGKLFYRTCYLGDRCETGKLFYGIDYHGNRWQTGKL